jgi:hypothetical protein
LPVPSNEWRHQNAVDLKAGETVHHDRMVTFRNVNCLIFPSIGEVIAHNSSTATIFIYLDAIGGQYLRGEELSWRELNDTYFHITQSDIGSITHQFPLEWWWDEKLCFKMCSGRGRYFQSHWPCHRGCGKKKIFYLDYFLHQCEPPPTPSPPIFITRAPPRSIEVTVKCKYCHYLLSKSVKASKADKKRAALEKKLLAHEDACQRYKMTCKYCLETFTRIDPHFQEPCVSPNKHYH